MACKFYYNPNAVPPDTEVVDKNWVAIYGGIDPDTATPEQLAAAGFYCFEQSPTPEFNYQIYYLESQYVTEGTNARQEFTVVALPLADSKATYTSEVKAKAYSILQPTDWLVVRQVENSAEIPTDWNTWREDIRLESQNKVAAIDACEDADALDAYVSSEAYSFWPPEPTTPKL